MADANGVPGPIRVLFVDAEEELPEISPVRAAGGTYQQALVFAARGGRLVGELELPLTNGGLSPAELAGCLRDTLGDAWTGTDAPAGPAVVAGELPFISVVIATTMQRLDELDRCLASLLALDYSAGFEVILVDNRPSPQRAALHERLTHDSRVSVVTEARPGISAARNRGARAARGDIVAFTDDDAVVHPRWLRGIGARFAADPTVDCVSGVVLPAELETPAQIWFERSGSKLEQRYRAVSFHNDPAWRTRRLGGLRRGRFEITATPEGGPADTHLVYRAGKFGTGANIAFRVSSLLALGGFEETLGTGTVARGAEDIAAIARLLHAGGRVTMDPAVIVHHYHRVDYEGSRQQMYGYGVGATAAFTALVRSDPRHLIGLAHMALPGVRVLFGKAGERKAGEYPKDLARVEMRGLLVGPFAYVRSLMANTGRR